MCEEFNEFEEIRDFLGRVLVRLDGLERKLERKLDQLTWRQNSMNGDELLDTQDLCLLLKTSKRTLQRYRNNGVLPFHTLEGKVYYKLSDIHEFIRNSFQPAKRKPKPPKPEMS
jgi:hypothetical protein